MGWATLLSDFSQTHLVTLLEMENDSNLIQSRKEKELLSELLIWSDVDNDILNPCSFWRVEGNPFYIEKHSQYICSLFYVERIFTKHRYYYNDFLWGALILLALIPLALGICYNLHKHISLLNIRTVIVLRQHTFLFSSVSPMTRWWEYVTHVYVFDIYVFDIYIMPY
jgi:hypothetical protein